MDKKKKIIISIIAGSVLVSTAVGVGVGVYFSNIKKPSPPVSRLILNTFYYFNRDESRINWEIDTLDYKVEFINYSENNSSRLNFSVDNVQGFYNDCIKPYISSSLTEYTIEDKKVRLFFYDKAPIYYLENNESILMYAYGTKMGNTYLTPFFQDPDTMNSNYGSEVVLDYPSSNMDLQKKDNLFLREIGSYIKLENFNDAKEIFEKHLDPNSFLINSSEKSITVYNYDTIRKENEDKSYGDFDKNVYAKYTFNEDSIVFTYYNKYYEDTINNPPTK